MKKLRSARRSGSCYNVTIRVCSLGFPLLLCYLSVFIGIKLGKAAKLILSIHLLLFDAGRGNDLSSLIEVEIMNDVIAVVAYIPDDYNGHESTKHTRKIFRFLSFRKISKYK